MTPLRRFVQDEDGAITVDWVVLTAAIVGLGIAVGIVIRPAIGDLANDSNDVMTDYEVSSTF